MKSYAVCPCCSNKLIHHISNHRDYWFCRRCWQEMPRINLNMIQSKADLESNQNINLVQSDLA